MSRHSVAVIGGGIAGLAAAYRLSALAAGQVVLVESSPRLGGKVCSVDLDGDEIEAGPDSFLTRNPAAMQLCTELGVAGELVAPAPLGALLWVRGRLRPLPRDLAHGLPRDLKSLARSGAVSLLGVARAAVERLLPIRKPDGDVSIGELVRARFGDEVFEAVVDPLLSGINAGNADRLSAEFLVPHLLDALRSGEPLSALPAPTSSGPAFLTLPDGLGSLIDALGRALPQGSVRLDNGAVAVRQVESGYRVALSSGDEIQSHAVVLATPPRATAELLHSISTQTAELVSRIETVPVATVAMRYPRGRVCLPSATGFLVPRRDGRFLVGCTFVSQKWPHLGRSEHTLIRCAVGRDGGPEWQGLQDSKLIEKVLAELREATGIAQEPDAVAVRRFSDGLPQYRVGHKALVEEIEARLAAHSGIAVAGSAYHGVGLPACIASGTRAAERVVESLRLVAA